jgi:hypothetical protein
MPHYADTTDVREEAGNILAVDFSDAEIVEEQEAAYDFISSEIGAYDDTHPKIAAIKKLEIKLAASFVMDHFSQYKEKAKQKQDESYRLLETLKKGLVGGAADVGDFFATTTYQSYSAAMSVDPTQTTVRPYSSMKPITSFSADIGPEPYQKPWYYYTPIKTRPV